MKVSEQRIDFTTGPIVAPLLKFAGPVLLALFLQAMYGAVDLLVVGKFASPADVSAVSTGSQIMMTITNLISSLCMGITILLGQKIGEKKTEEGGRIVGSGLLLFLSAGVVLTLLIPPLSPKLAGIMHAPQEAFDLTAQYIRICGAGSIIIIAYNLIGGIFRGMGDSNTPLVTVLIACISNIAGDLLLVAGFHLGTRGAAIATVAAQLISVVISCALKDSVSGNADRPAGSAGRHLVPCGSGHRQFDRPYGVRGRRCCRKGLRVHYACAFGVHAVHVRICRAEPRRRKDGSRVPGIQIRSGDFICLRRFDVLSGVLPRRSSLRHLRE